MTLIAAFRCREGVVIAADSQETAGDYRVQVTKIKPKRVGPYWLMIGGAGNDGELIDGFTDSWADEMGTWSESLDFNHIKTKLHAFVQDYHRNEVANSPAERDDKRMSFIVCIKNAITKETCLFKIKTTTVSALGEWELIGYDDQIFKHEVEKLYYPDIPLSQGVLLAVNLLMLAKKTSNYVGPPTQIFVVTYEGEDIFTESQDDISLMESHITEFNRVTTQVALRCLDSSILPDRIEAILAEFKDAVGLWRNRYIKRRALSSLIRGVSDPEYRGHPFCPIPLGTRLDIDKLEDDELVVKSLTYLLKRDHDTD